MHQFSPATQRWFTASFAAPTSAQELAWEAIASGENTLVVAPTGSGKTLAAFLWALDRLAHGAPATAEPGPAPGVKVLYISPLKALGVDVERNLRAPLAGIREATSRLGHPDPNIAVGVRTGDTPPAQRRRLIIHPPDILITTPESLYLLLTSQGAKILETVETVIVDEIHALAGNKRGAHLALSLERLDASLPRPAQRIGLSATVRPIDKVALYLGGSQPVTVVDSGLRKRFDLTVEVPAPDMTNPPLPPAGFFPDEAEVEEHRLGSMWPLIEISVYQRVLQETSTIVFANSRRQVERLTARLNEIHLARDPDASPLARAHHGSVSKEQRADVEEGLKSGTLRCVVATSSLELGIDMGRVDQVIQIDPPPSVASGLQRVGRAGHQVGEISRGVFYPTHRSKLVEMATVTRRILAGEIEPLELIENPLDVLAQQTVAAVSQADWEVDAWLTVVRRAAPFRDLPRSAFEATLDLLAGKYPSAAFANLRPRIVWDRLGGVLQTRPGAGRLAVTNGGTIPDRGMFRVVTPEEDGKGSRVGELDEEMVYESRVGEVFTLGTTSWRITDITKDTVEVAPAFGQVGKIPFWRADSPTRPPELGEAIGKLTRELTASLRSGDRAGAEALLAASGFDTNAAANTLAYLQDQLDTAGIVASDRDLVVERTKDEVGDWRLILESPYGREVHEPWALAVRARVEATLGIEGSVVASNDGIILRLPDTDQEPPGAEIFLFTPEEAEAVVVEQVGGSPLFAARFRECSARALLLGGGKPGQRAPLWQQRQRSARLLEVATRYPDFPMVLETLRECLRDVYDMAALQDLLRRFADRRAFLHTADPALPSPFAQALLFGYVGQFLYEGDVPVGERKLAALTVDPELLGELLGGVALRDLLEPAALLQVEAELQRLAAGWTATGVEGTADLLRTLGPLSSAEIARRLADPGSADENLTQLLAARRILEVRVGGQQRYAAIEDAGLLQQGLGVPLPPGVPAAFLDPRPDAAAQLVERWAHTHGPFTEAQLTADLGLSARSAGAALRSLADQNLLVRGEFLPEAPPGETQWVDPAVLRRLRDRSLALLRGSVEPVPQSVFAAFLAEWQGCGGQGRGVDGVLGVIEQLAGLALPASSWETLVLPERVAGYEPGWLEGLISSGEVLWAGSSPLGAGDGWVAFYPADLAPVLLPGAAGADAGPALTSTEEAILTLLRERGASFAPALRAGLAERGVAVSTPELREALWNLVWLGQLTNDSFEPVRAAVSGKRAAQKTSARRPRGRRLRPLAAHVPGVEAPRDPRVSGRWSLLPSGGDEPARKALQVALLLDRYPVVTKKVTALEPLPGGFAGIYPALADLERSGPVRRGYLVSGLGGAQFALAPAVERLRDFADQVRKQPAEVRERNALTLGATDPANPYGALLEWPDRAAKQSEGTARPDAVAQKPRRAAGALVVLADGFPLFYLERGGRTAVNFLRADDPDLYAVGANSLAATLRRAGAASFTLETIDRERADASPWYGALVDAGFGEVPQGLRWRRASHARR